MEGVGRRLAEPKPLLAGPGGTGWLSTLAQQPTSLWDVSGSQELGQSGVPALGGSHSAGWGEMGV